MSSLKKTIGKMNGFEKACAVFFVIFAIISCTATAQSLCLTLELGGPQWQWLIFIICFIFAFGLYFLTSYCVKYIIDSTNYEIYKRKEDRKRELVLGICGTALFWMICSMPTNTHSLLYTKVIDKVAIAELDNEYDVFKNAYFLTDEAIEKKYQSDLSSLISDVTNKKSLFINEINHTDRPGLGPEAHSILLDIQVRCGKSIDESYYLHTTQHNTSAAERKRIKNHYIPQIDHLLEWAKGNLLVAKEQAIAQNQPQKEVLKGRMAKIEGAKNQLLADKTTNHHVRVNNARLVIADGYNQPAYKDQLLDNIEMLNDPKLGHQDSNVKYYKIYKIERLHSVFKVWGDLLSKRMQNLDFDILYWIIISIIIDVAGLAFFGIAFRAKP